MLEAFDAVMYRQSAQWCVIGTPMKHQGAHLGFLRGGLKLVIKEGQPEGSE